MTWVLSPQETIALAMCISVGAFFLLILLSEIPDTCVRKIRDMMRERERKIWRQKAARRVRLQSEREKEASGSAHMV